MSEKPWNFFKSHTSSQKSPYEENLEMFSSTKAWCRFAVTLFRDAFSRSFLQNFPRFNPDQRQVMPKIWDIRDFKIWIHHLLLEQTFSMYILQLKFEKALPRNCRLLSKVPSFFSRVWDSSFGTRIFNQKASWDRSNFQVF
jgi:hypothetical protein